MNREQIKQELRDENPSSYVNGILYTAGDAVYEELLEQWVNARVEQFDTTPPIIVSFRALAFALEAAGLYSSVKAAALATTEGEIWWETAKSSTVARDHPFVAQLQSVLGKTDAEIDAIFDAAK